MSFFRRIQRTLPSAAPADVPMKLVRLAIEMGMQLPQVTSNAALQNLDLEAIFRMVESGVIGKLLDVEVDDVTKVAVLVE